MMRNRTSKRKAAGLSFFDFEKEEGPFFGSKDISPLFPSALRHWVNTAGVSALTILFLICAYQAFKAFLFPAPDLISSRQITKSSPIPAEAFKPFLQYADLFKRREIFKVYEKASPFVAPVTPRATLAEQVSGFSLIGIIFEKEPQAIIEDKKTGKTYFLKKGDYLNNIKVEEIKRGKVRLRLDTETMELEL